jgi:hypothetical protein
MNNALIRIKGITIDYPNSTADQILAALSDLERLLSSHYSKLLFICFGISVLWRMIESITQSDKNFRVGDLIAHLLLAHFFMGIWQVYCSSMTNFTNILADIFYSIDETETLMVTLWEEAKETSSFGLFKISMHNVFASLMAFISLLAAIGVFAARKVVLSFFFIFGGLMIAISILPCYGYNHVGKLVKTQLQVSAWVITHSAFLLIISKWAASPNTGSLEFFVMGLMLVLVSLKIPKMAEFLFGGESFASSAIGANLVTGALLKMGLSPMKGLAKNSPFGMAAGMITGQVGKAQEGLYNQASSYHQSRQYSGGMPENTPIKNAVGKFLFNQIRPDLNPRPQTTPSVAYSSPSGASSYAQQLSTKIDPEDPAEKAYRATPHYMQEVAYGMDPDRREKLKQEAYKKTNHYRTKMAYG